MAEFMPGGWLYLYTYRHTHQQIDHAPLVLFSVGDQALLDSNKGKGIQTLCCCAVPLGAGCMNQGAGCIEVHQVAVHIPAVHAQEAAHIPPSSPDAVCGCGCGENVKVTDDAHSTVGPALWTE